MARKDKDIAKRDIAKRDIAKRDKETPPPPKLTEDLQGNSAYAAAKFLWISPFKVRRIANHVRYLSVRDATGVLAHFPQKTALYLSKTIKSATANLLHKNRSINEKDIVITKLLVDEGPRIKRLWHRGRGRADILLKRMCHIRVHVGRLTDLTQYNQKKYRKIKEISTGSVPHATGISDAQVVNSTPTSSQNSSERPPSSSGRSDSSSQPQHDQHTQHTSRSLLRPSKRGGGASQFILKSTRSSKNKGTK